MSKPRGRPRGSYATPSYRLHKASGQAVVTLPGQGDIYLGKHDTPESRKRYDQALGRYLAEGRRAVQPGDAGITVADLIAAFWEYINSKRSYSMSAIRNFQSSFRPLNELYGQSIAQDFGPMKLKAVRRRMGTIGVRHTERVWCRHYINQNVARIKQLFAWGVSEELLPPTHIHALQTVPDLKQGEEGTREGRTVKPVDTWVVEATMRFLAPHFRDMVELQLLSGMRSGEVCLLRTCDIDTTGEVWEYKPHRHKTQKRGFDRTVYFGPRAQEILRKYLRPVLTEYLFQPAEGIQWAAEARRRVMSPERRRVMDRQNDWRRRMKAKLGQVRIKQRRPCYESTTYRQSLGRAIDKANSWAKGGLICDNDTRIVPQWHPHQLRHAAATHLREKFGCETARVILGHANLKTTELYAEQDVAKAIHAMREVG
jgi:integrase